MMKTKKCLAIMILITITCTLSGCGSAPEQNRTDTSTLATSAADNAASAEEKDNASTAVSSTETKEENSVKEEKQEEPAGEKKEDPKPTEENNKEQDAENNPVEYPAGAVVILADNRLIQDGDAITPDEARHAKLIINEPEYDYYWTTFVCSGAYHENEDPDPNWAYNNTTKSGVELDLIDQYTDPYLDDPTYDTLFLGYIKKDYSGPAAEYNFPIKR